MSDVTKPTIDSAPREQANGIMSKHVSCGMVMMDANMMFNLCLCLSAKDNLNLMRLNKHFASFIRNNHHLWSFLCTKIFGDNHELIPTFDESMLPAINQRNSKWMEAYKVLELRRQAAKYGRWFEFNGHFSQVGFPYDFSLSLHSVERMQSALPIPPVPVLVQQQSESLIQKQVDIIDSIGNVMQLPIFNEFTNRKTQDYPQTVQNVNTNFSQHGFIPTDEIVLATYYKHPVIDERYYTVPYQPENWEFVDSRLTMLEDVDDKFFPDVTPRETWPLRHKHVHAATNPLVERYTYTDTQETISYVPVMGVFTWHKLADDFAPGPLQKFRATPWTEDSNNNSHNNSHNNSNGSSSKETMSSSTTSESLETTTTTTADAEEAAMYDYVAQEFVHGIFNIHTRSLHLGGMGRSLSSFPTNLGVDMYNLAVSENYQTIDGLTLGIPEVDGVFLNPLKGFSPVFRNTPLMLDELRNNVFDASEKRFMH